MEIEPQMTKLMKKVLIVLILILISKMHYGQIIADHTVVDKYDSIPQEYIDEVKKMLLIVAGESHSNGYFEGLLSFEDLDSKYQVEWSSSGAPAGETDNYLRVGRNTWGDYDNDSGWINWYGEEDWFTNATALARTKTGISYCHDNNLTISAIGFGWCYDQIEGPNTTAADKVYGVRWAGRSVEGPEGNLAWGIDAEDFAITGNSISMDTYISATQEYINYCTVNNIPTKVFFTTGPVDDYSTEDHYGGYLKHEHLREYVRANPSLILFDYADILCFDDDGSGTTDSFNGTTFPAITPTNLSPVSAGHISKAGGVRLAKAMWWMLARMAGWQAGDTDNEVTLVTSISVTAEGGSAVIDTNAGTLQLSTQVSPESATVQSITWSLLEGTGKASLSSSGLVTAESNGTVTARATANDGSGVYDELIVTIENQISSSISEYSTGTNNFEIVIGRDVFEIYLQDGFSANQTNLYDVSGRLITKEVFNGNYCQIETGNLPEGIYIIQVLSESMLYRSKKIFKP